jgi:quercetin dioxygenase-like cupin family protein
MPSQANSVGHDPVLRSTADGVACSLDAAADRCRHGSRPSILLCLNPARIVISIYEIAAGTTLREHKHASVRYAYVLTGTLRVTNTETGYSNVYKAADFIIQAIGQWHQAVNLGDRPLKLLVIDQQADEKSNVVMRE